MATINLTVVIPDAQLPRVQAAARATYGQVPNGSGGMRDMTNAELVERLRTEVMSYLRSMTLNAEETAARKALVTLDLT